MTLNTVKSTWSRPQARRRRSRGGMHSSSSSTCGEAGVRHSPDPPNPPQPPPPLPRSPPAPHHVPQLGGLHGEAAREDDGGDFCAAQGQQRPLVLGGGK